MKRNAQNKKHVFGESRETQKGVQRSREFENLSTDSILNMLREAKAIGKGSRKSAEGKPWKLSREFRWGQKLMRCNRNFLARR